MLKLERKQTIYIEKEEKLFYWYDSTEILKKNIVQKLDYYNLVDSSNVKKITKIPEFGADDSQKALHYFICKKNYLHYKKVVANIAIGYYSLPKWVCGVKHSVIDSL